MLGFGQGLVASSLTAARGSSAALTETLQLEQHLRRRRNDARVGAREADGADHVGPLVSELSAQGRREPLDRDGRQARTRQQIGART